MLIAAGAAILTYNKIRHNGCQALCLSARVTVRYIFKNPQDDCLQYDCLDT
jgi:hypothetical protein